MGILLLYSGYLADGLPSCWSGYSSGLPLETYSHNLDIKESKMTDCQEVRINNTHTKATCRACEENQVIIRVFDDGFVEAECLICGVLEEL